MEIMVGAAIGYAAYNLHLTENLSLHVDWLKFCTGVGAIMLTFLAGAELNPGSMKSKLKEISIIGFFAPFIGCSLIACYLIGWNLQASLLCGIAFPTTSMASSILIIRSIVPMFFFICFSFLDSDKIRKIFMNVLTDFAFFQQIPTPVTKLYNLPIGYLSTTNTYARQYN
jgi:Kef-type K+ transport system membrane component KefB